MSALDVFTKHAWFRRLWLFAIGALLGLGYLYAVIDDDYVTPGLVGILIGLLSGRWLWALVNAVMVVIGMTASIAIVIIAGMTGSGRQFPLESYRNVIADSFVAGGIPVVALIPALFVGFGLRQVFLHLRNREKAS